MDYLSWPYDLWLCALAFQVDLALSFKACQPSNSAQEFPINRSTMTYRPKSSLFKLAYFSTLSLAGLTGFVACGDSEQKEKPPAAQKVATSPTMASEAPSNRIAIPFNIAIEAALNGHEETVVQALETGTDPNQIDDGGRTLLMVSSFNGHSKTVKRLLDAGAKLDTKDLSGRTALMYASTGTDIPTISLLLEHKAQVNLVDGEEQFSAIMFAAAEGNKEVVELLLQNGADITLVDIDGESAELFARNNGHIEVADFLKSISEQNQLSSK
jgi:ankyrin repeat protein